MGLNWVGTSIWGPPPPVPPKEIVYQLGDLEVCVDLSPVGGYRGPAGTLTIGHQQGFVFTQWNSQNLQNLALIINKILKIREKAGIQNNLIFAQQQENHFKFSVVPYPICGLLEKIRGLLDVIFGTSVLRASQVQEIASYNRKQFKQLEEEEGVEYTDTESLTRDPLKPDAFCRAKVIDTQRFASVRVGDQEYDLLQDNRPKGAKASDAHVLIIPPNERGHCDGSHVPTAMRYHLLIIAQVAMRIFQGTGKYTTYLLLERNGPLLQNVKHKHVHAKGLEEFPTSVWGKLRALFRQVYVPSLSIPELRARITSLAPYFWQYNVDQAMQAGI